MNSRVFRINLVYGFGYLGMVRSIGEATHTNAHSRAVYNKIIWLIPVRPIYFKIKLTSITIKCSIFDIASMLPLSVYFLCVFGA